MVNAEVVARDFDSTEVSEICAYLEKNVPSSGISAITVITEKPIEKAIGFTMIYRLVNSAMNMVKEQATREKLRALLDESKGTYSELYELLSKYQFTNVSFGRHITENKIMKVFMDQDKNMKINKLIDIFLVFAEKQQLYETDKIAGLDLENDSGQKMYKDLMTSDAPGSDAVAKEEF